MGVARAAGLARARPCVEAAADPVAAVAGDRHRRVPLRNLVNSIDTERQYGNLSSAIRLFVLDYYQKATASSNRSFVAADQAAH